MAEASKCHLLALPAELRSAIWEILLIQPTPYLPSRFLAPAAAEAVARTSGRTEAQLHSASVALLQTCKQICNEGIPILYGSNTFLAHASLLSALPCLLVATRPRPVGYPPVKHDRLVRLIRRFYLHVRLDTDPRFTKAQVEDCFSGCDALALDVFQAMYGSCDFGVLELFEGVRGVGVAMVQGSIGNGKYARWLEACMSSPRGSEARPFHEDWVGGAKGW